jgi:signal transduction histidine kinase
MQLFLYLRLVVLTAGSLLPFFWIVVILGHRRQRNFERVFFFLCLALVFLFGGSLLDLNAELYYAAIPPALTIFAWSVVCIGLWILPSLIIHLHVEYAQIRELLGSAAIKRWWLLAAYAPAALLLPRLFQVLLAQRQLEFEQFDFVYPGNSFGILFQAWLVFSLLISCYWQSKFLKAETDDQQQRFHRNLQRYFVVLALCIFAIHALLASAGRGSAWGVRSAICSSILLILALKPLVDLIRNLQKFNFLQIGRQRNLMYAVFAAFVGLLYLSLIRRASLWLEPYLPPEATAALLLFLPVACFEPLQRLVNRMLRRTAQTEMDRAQRMMGPIQEVARLGSLEKLKDFIQKWIADELQLAEVQLRLDANPGSDDAEKKSRELFPIRKGTQTVGELRVKPYGAMLSGETEAALGYLCEQLPGPIDLCRLIDEKLHLERELAERERLAVLGQMAASISHNLKNPLGSIKTILQVQLESSELPDSLRAETKMVLTEINRLSSTLSQLLKFSRPTLLGETPAAETCDPSAVLAEVLTVLTHEAEKRGITFNLESPQPQIQVAASKEAVHDILSNLVLNALEATLPGGQVAIKLQAANDTCEITLDDEGPGIPVDLQQKILEPFFTTKTQGTGLGLTVVTRRVTEVHGTLNFVSPKSTAGGTHCAVTLRLAEKPM